jgi:hypothetical protein
VVRQWLLHCGGPTSVEKDILPLPLPKRVIARYYLFFFFLVGLGFEFRASCQQSRHSKHLNHNYSPFCSGYFENGVLWIICLGWPRTGILLISVSQVVGITGMSHQHPAPGWQGANLRQTEIETCWGPVIREHSQLMESWDTLPCVWVGDGQNRWSKRGRGSDMILQRSLSSREFWWQQMVWMATSIPYSHQ